MTVILAKCDGEFSVRCNLFYSSGHAAIFYKNILKRRDSKGQKMLGLRGRDFKSMITIRKLRISVPLNQGK